MRNQARRTLSGSPSEREGRTRTTTQQDETMAKQAAPTSNADQAVENQERALESGEENPS